MSTATQQRTHTPAQTSHAGNGTALDAAIAATPFQKITQALTTRAKDGSIEALLPDFMKGQAERLVARARQYWARADYKLQQCTEASFIGCVLAAAELGFAIDGRMCHAVPFNTKVKLPGGGEKWEGKAQLIVDYKGLIAVAKRHGLIQDCWSRIVVDGDDLDLTEANGKVDYRYRPDLEAARDRAANARGVLTVATHKDGWCRVDFMSMADVYDIRNRSKGYSADKPSGPWHTDPGEMAKKTGLKRMLKTFGDDPGLLRAMELDEPEPSYSLEDAGITPRVEKTKSLIPSRASVREEEPEPPFNPPTKAEQEEAAAILAAETPDMEPEAVATPEAPAGDAMAQWDAFTETLNQAKKPKDFAELSGWVNSQTGLPPAMKDEMFRRISTAAALHAPKKAKQAKPELFDKGQPQYE